MQISHKLWVAIKLSGIPQWKLARQSGFHPTYLGRIMANRARLKKDDPRVHKLGELLGVPKHQLFIEEREIKR